MGKEDEIRLIAYNIWQQDGCCDGHDCEHWLRAEAVWEEKRKEKTFSVKAASKPKSAAGKVTKKRPVSQEKIAMGKKQKV